MRVRKGILMSVLVGLAFLLSGNAFAYHMVPVSTIFAVQGPFTLNVLGVSIPCTAQFLVDNDDSDHPSITAAKFVGSPTCLTFRANALPWSLQILTQNQGEIQNMSVSTPFGTCTGNAFVFFDVPNSRFILSGSLGLCSVSASLVVSPSYSIVLP